MKSPIIPGLVLTLLTGVALAQTPADPPPADDASTVRVERVAPMPPRGYPGGRRPPPPPSRAAHFRLERGNAALDVTCGEDDTMKACAGIALQMLDKVQALPPAKP